MSADESATSINALLDRAVRAINHGDPTTAATLAGRVLSVDHGNADAQDLLAASAHHGELRRLAIMFVDLVNSTALSTRLEPEVYHALVGQYRDTVQGLVRRYEGHISSTKGDGLLAVFGHPTAHENDVHRAVTAGLDITQAVARLGAQAERAFGVAIGVRVGIHRGLVYLDTREDDVYGFAANLAARICALAEPDTVAVSDAVALLVRDSFELSNRPPASVKGVDDPVDHHRVIAERPTALTLPRHPLVGRDRERDWLIRSWRLACDGALDTPGVIFRGESGMGKTRLTAEAAAIVAPSHGPVIELTGSPLHTEVGLHPVRRLLEQRCGISRMTDGRQRLQLLKAELDFLALDSGSELPLLAPILGVGPEHGYQPAAVEGQILYTLIIAAAHRYVLACLGGRPGLVIAEDVHWFDPSTRDLLRALLAGADGRLLTVITGRDIDWLDTDWPATTFEIGPLSTAQCDVLVEALLPAATPDQRTAVCNRCDGVPLYIEHVAGGLSSIQDGLEAGIEDGAGAERQVPEALYESLFARLYARPDVVPVVEAAAVIGRSGDRELLRLVVGSDSPHPAGTADIGGVVDDLAAARVFELDKPGSWRFRHELFREVAAELAPPSLRRNLHERTAHALVAAATDAEPDWRVIAGHFEHADRHADAVTAYQRASVDARRRGAIREALGYLAKALDQLEGCTAGPRRDSTEIAIRLERGLLAGAAEGSTTGDGPAEFERCLKLASGGSHVNDLFLTLIALIGYYVPRAELRRARQLLDSLSNRIPQDWGWSEPAIAYSLGAISWLEGDFATAEQHLRVALADSGKADPRELARTSWADDPISSAHNYVAQTHLMRGDLDSADAELAESIVRCAELGFPQNVYNRARTYFVQIWVCLETGRTAEAAVLVRQLHCLAEQSGLGYWTAVSATQYTTVKAVRALTEHADAAALASAAEQLAQWVDGSRMVHLNIFLTFHDSVIARVLTAAGKPEQARARLDSALQHADDTGMHFQDAELLRLRAQTLTEPQQRRAVLTAALQTARRQGANLFELRCLLDLFDLVGDEARTELADAAGRFPGDARWPERTRANRILS